MKTHPNGSPHAIVLSHLRQHPWGLGLPSLSLLVAILLALVQREDDRLTKLASALPGQALYSSKIKQLHRFFKNIQLPGEVLARFVLSFADPKEGVWLVMDRTNWQLGQRPINILVVAVLIRDQALPFMWTLLLLGQNGTSRACPPHGASSNAATRNALLERILLVLPAELIAGLLGDREFIGKQWFQFLSKHHVAPCIRLKADTRVGGMPVWGLFKGIAAHEVRWWYWYAALEAGGQSIQGRA